MLPFLLIWLILILPAEGKGQPWQTVDALALKFIFGNWSGLSTAVTDFSNADNLQAVLQACNDTAHRFSIIDYTFDSVWLTSQPRPEFTKQGLTSTGCRNYFLHRFYLQKWVDYLFLELTRGPAVGRITLSIWKSASMKSLFWSLDKSFHNIFSCTMKRFAENADKKFTSEEKTKFLATIKAILSNFQSTSSDPSWKSDLQEYLFSYNEGSLRGDRNYFYTLVNEKTISTVCTNRGDFGEDFSPNSWMWNLTASSNPSGNK